MRTIALIRKAAVIGASGYVGARLLARLGPRGLGTHTSREAPGSIRFDLAKDGLGALGPAGPELSHLFIAGAIADPERCVRQPEVTRAINVTGTIRLAREAMVAGVIPIFLSTDYVFRGDVGGYGERDASGPTTEYGRQKAEVEAWFAAQNGPSLTARLSKVVGPESNVHSVLGQWVSEIKAGKTLRCATDQVFSPAWVEDVASALIDLSEAGETGVWNVAGPQPISRYDLAALLVDSIGKIDPSVHIDLEACRLRDIAFSETRPLRTFLNTQRLMAWLPWRFQSMQAACAATARLHFG